jgi:hypothetical protein
LLQLNKFIHLKPVNICGAEKRGLLLAFCRSAVAQIRRSLRIQSIRPEYRATSIMARMRDTLLWHETSMASARWNAEVSISNRRTWTNERRTLARTGLTFIVATGTSCLYKPKRARKCSENEQGDVRNVDQSATHCLRHSDKLPRLLITNHGD